MTMLPRLEKAARTMTAQERIALFLRARNSGETPPVLKNEDFVDGSQLLLYDRYMSVIYVANSELANLLELIHTHLSWVAEDRLLHEVLREAALRLANQQGEEIDWRKLRRLPRGKDVSIPVYVADLSQHVLDLMTASVEQRWREFAALERVWSVMAEDFCGDDPVDPLLRQKADETRILIEGLAERCGLKKLPVADQESIDRVWELVDRTYETLKLVKPEP